MKNSAIVTLPRAKVTRTSIVTYDYLIDRLPRSNSQKATEGNLAIKEVDGFLSTKAKRRLKAVVNTFTSAMDLVRYKPKNWITGKKPYIALITLTLSAPQSHTDLFIKRHFLNSFLIFLKTKHKVVNYIWRAEPQENGNIHFHIVVDAFVEWRLIRDEWNEIQARHGYIDKFEAKHGHRHPNSTDIHKPEDIKNMGAYICKYISKAGNYRAIQGRLWGCSDQLRKVVPFAKFIDTKLANLITTGTTKQLLREFKGDKFTVYVGNVFKLIKGYCKCLYKEIYEHYVQIFENLQQIAAKQSKRTENPKTRASPLFIGFQTVFDFSSVSLSYAKV